MEQRKIDFYVGANVENFTAQDLTVVKQTLEGMDDARFYMVQGLEFQKPSFILLIAILLGWDRLFLGDVALGLLKIFTGYGCGIWWLIDIFSAKDRAKKYNFQKFMKMASIAE